MRFMIIDPKRVAVEFVDAKELTEVYPKVGLNTLGVDHGVVGMIDGDDRDFVNIVVYEFGLFKPDTSRYWSMGGKLYADGAVLYAANQAGETIDMPEGLPAVFFYRDKDEVEKAIQEKQIERPTMAVNGEIIWRWPEAPPFDLPEGR